MDSPSNYWKCDIIDPKEENRVYTSTEKTSALQSIVEQPSVTLDGRIHSYVFARSTVTAVRHRDEVLDPYVRHYTNAVGPNFILMEDNMRHRKLI
ncbi:hypothetical protein TNCV_3394171 [Trichonephila clavipes]|nr:hypothetical protein TNCV_3394171 [Trichonephila clavipes]